MDFLKAIRISFVFLILTCCNAFAIEYDLSMDWHRDKQDYTQKALIKDKASKKVIKEIALSDSYKKEALFYRRKNSPFAFFYTEPKSLKGPKGLIQIINLDTLSISHELIVDKITHTKFKQKIHTYLGVSKDGKHLIVQIGKGKNQKLINIAGETGKIIKSISLGRRKILVKNGTDIEYIWTRFASKAKGNVLKIYKANTLEFIRDVFLYGKLESISHYKDYIFIKEKIVNSQKPKENRYNLKIVSIENEKLYKNFSSSGLPIEFIFKQKIVYLIGRSFDTPKHLKVVRFKDEIFTDISVKSIDAIPEVLKGYENDKEQTLFVFGKSSVVKFNILEPEKSKKITTPFKIEGGIVSADKQKVYVLANFGAKIGLADFEKEAFMGSDHTGSNAKKVSNVLFNLAVMAATGAATGIAYAPGFKLSSNTMMLSLNQKFLFVINVKTDDVSIFNAEDLSHKRIFPTGERTFQILQPRHEDNLPVAIISQKLVSFFDPTTGELIYSKDYDRFVKITDELDLIYIKEKKQARISLHKSDSWN